MASDEGASDKISRAVWLHASCRGSSVLPLSNGVTG